MSESACAHVAGESEPRRVAPLVYCARDMSSMARICSVSMLVSNPTDFACANVASTSGGRVADSGERRCTEPRRYTVAPVSYTHLRAHETPEHLVCRLLLEKKKK